MLAPLTTIAALASLAVASNLLASAANAAPGVCACQHAKALKADLETARFLRDAFLRKGQELAGRLQRGEQTLRQSQDALQVFRRSEALKVQAPPGYHGPETAHYVPVGYDELEKYAEGPKLENFLKGLRNNRKRNVASCKRNPRSLEELRQVEAGSVCVGMARAARAHEDHHLGTCREHGFVTYWYERSGAEEAAEEAQAYAAQIKVLEMELAKLTCDYRIEYRYANGPISGYEQVLKCGGPRGNWLLETGVKNRAAGQESTLDVTVTFSLDEATLSGRYALAFRESQFSHILGCEVSACEGRGTGIVKLIEEQSEAKLIFSYDGPARATCLSKIPCSVSRSDVRELPQALATEYQLEEGSFCR
jgi:hypothetical protein